MPAEWAATPWPVAQLLAISAAASPSRSQTASGRPTAASAEHTAAPMPDAPPVTITPLAG
jgi:hypothetical protein